MLQPESRPQALPPNSDSMPPLHRSLRLLEFQREFFTRAAAKEVMDLGPSLFLVPEVLSEIDDVGVLYCSSIVSDGFFPPFRRLSAKAVWWSGSLVDHGFSVGCL